MPSALSQSNTLKHLEDWCLQFSSLQTGVMAIGSEQGGLDATSVCSDSQGLAPVKTCWRWCGALSGHHHVRSCCTFGLILRCLCASMLHQTDSDTSRQGAIFQSRALGFVAAQRTRAALEARSATLPCLGRGARSLLGCHTSCSCPEPPPEPSSPNAWSIAACMVSIMRLPFSKRGHGCHQHCQPSRCAHCA